MGSAKSLTDAVKAAATESTSLTDAVKEAARSGADTTVINFPRLAFEARQDATVPVIRPLRMDAAAAHGPERPSPAAAPERDCADRLEEAQPEAAPTVQRKRRLQLRRRRLNAWAAAFRRALAALRGLLPGGAAFRTLAAGVRLAVLRLTGFVVIACLSLVAVPSPVGSGSDGPLPIAVQRRVALVIGNSAYRHARKLENPRNDATDIGAALRRLGFRVIEGFDLSKAALEGKIREFTAVLRGADVGVFFYAGHGLNVSGQNYLVPVDAELTGISALDLELVRLDLVHRTMEREARTSILFFDACRDTPLSDNLARSMGTRSVEIGRGLAVVQGSAGTLISFSTQPGTVALDGKGRNSPYSAALARQLATSQEDLGSMLIAIRNDVMRETDRRQVPWEHSALTGRFYFHPTADTATARTAATSPAAHEAFEAWSVAKDTTSLAVLEAYVARYGDTFYAELARARMAELRKHGPAATVSPLAARASALDP
jgi:uncharacterized caspase-like protein